MGHTAISGTAEPSQPSFNKGRRIQAIDALRGFALLGILIMNIPHFAGPFVLHNPTAYGNFAGMEQWIWNLSHILADQKFMTIFSPLYGAGILLLISRLEQRVGAYKVAFFARSIWLLLFGLAHYFLLWEGDILITYALAGMVAYFFRGRKASTLLVLGLTFVSMNTIFIFGARLAPPGELEDLIRYFNGSPEDNAALIDIFQGPYTGQLRHRFLEFGDSFLPLLGFWGFWRAGGLMLIGMAALKWNVLTAECTDRFYINLALLGLGVGWPVVAWGLWDNMRQGWNFWHSFFGVGFLYNYWGSLLVSAGYIAIVMLWERREWLPRMKHRLAAVGRMAFTNYILHTLICSFIFYGFGLGFYAQVNRIGQMGIVLSVWLFQLWLSPLWLERFRYGPLEWMWRSLTYFERIPFKRAYP